MTAKHVLLQAISLAQETGQQIGVVGKTDDGMGTRSIVAPLLAAEGAPNDADIAIMFTRYRSKSFLRLSKDRVDFWKDVATLGYPDEAVSGNPGKLNLNLRAQKGYIQRHLKVGDLVHIPQLSGYELSFMLSEGMSGAPIFVHTREGDLVVGVAVGTAISERQISVITEVKDGGKEYQEIQNSMNRHGIAASVELLFDWKPETLLGCSLGNFLSGERPNCEQIHLVPGRYLAINL